MVLMVSFFRRIRSQNRALSVFVDFLHVAPFCLAFATHHDLHRQRNRLVVLYLGLGRPIGLNPSILPPGYPVTCKFIPLCPKSLAHGSARFLGDVRRIGELQAIVVARSSLRRCVARLSFPPINHYVLCSFMSDVWYASWFYG